MEVEDENTLVASPITPKFENKLSHLSKVLHAYSSQLRIQNLTNVSEKLKDEIQALNKENDEMNGKIEKLDKVYFETLRNLAITFLLCLDR